MPQNSVIKFTFLYFTDLNLQEIYAFKSDLQEWGEYPWLLPTPCGQTLDSKIHCENTPHTQGILATLVPDWQLPVAVNMAIAFWEKKIQSHNCAHYGSCIIELLLAGYANWQLPLWPCWLCHWGQSSQYTLCIWKYCKYKVFSVPKSGGGCPVQKILRGCAANTSSKRPL